MSKGRILASHLLASWVRRIVRFSPERSFLRPSNRMSINHSEGFHCVATDSPSVWWCVPLTGCLRTSKRRKHGNVCMCVCLCVWLWVCVGDTSSNEINQPTRRASKQRHPTLKPFLVHRLFLPFHRSVVLCFVQSTIAQVRDFWRMLRMKGWMDGCIVVSWGCACGCMFRYLGCCNGVIDEKP